MTSTKGVTVGVSNQVNDVSVAAENVEEVLVVATTQDESCCPARDV
jgi:hypothetical protein